VKDAAALVLLGANLGPRERTLASAVKGLRSLRGVKVEKVSRLFETAPVGPSSEPYLNQAVRLRASRTPMGLLVEFKALEAAAGRRPGKKWGARLLDIDLVEFGKVRLKTPWLTVPHPEMKKRLFAAGPLSGVSAAWRRRYLAMKPDPRKARIY
jgi:2-amino-4-hydroxy-6-hydroxymethyldihydropteridine diphosphokinase